MSLHRQNMIGMEAEEFLTMKILQTFTFGIDMLKDWIMLSRKAIL